MNSLIDWLETHRLPCFYKSALGMECPGCGAQRSFILLLKGNFYESFLAYPPLLLFLGLILFLCLHLVFRFRKGAWILLYGFILTAAATMINFILKLANHENPFG